MAPPLIQLKDIRLTFGGTPLLSGVELSVSVGRARLPDWPQRFGQIDAPEIAAGLVEPNAEAASCGRAQPLAICRRSLISATTKTTLAYVEAGARPRRRSPPGALSPGAARAPPATKTTAHALRR